MSLNKAMIIGRLGSDPEMRTTGSGSTMTTFSLATSENWKDKEGAKQERTEWHRIVTWGRTAEICGQYLAKGRQVYVEGRIQTRSWEDQQGQKRYTTEIVAQTVQFIGGAQNASQGDFNSPQQDSGPFNNFAPEPEFNNADGEIPF